MAKSAEVIWIGEAEAAKMLTRKPETLRKNVKSGRWPVSFRTVAGKSFQYSEADLEKVFSIHRA